MKLSFLSHILKSKLLFLLLAPLLLLLNACGKKINITSNTFADTKNIPRGFKKRSTFFVKTTKQEKKLLAKEVAQKVEWLLEEKGYDVTNQQDADYHVTFDFSMVPETRTAYITQYIPGDKQITTGRKVGDSNVTYQEQTETVGRFVNVPQEYPVWTHKLMVHVVDARESQKEEVWQGSAISTEENDDLREIIDYLLVTAFKFFGHNTQHKVQTSMSIKDQEVKALRGDLFYQR